MPRVVDAASVAAGILPGGFGVDKGIGLSRHVYSSDAESAWRDAPPYVRRDA
jgi:hypothetical protein